MIRVRFAALAASLSLTLTACGSESPASPTGGGNNPPPPTSVATIDVSPATADVVVAKTTKLSATPRDASQAPLSTFTRRPAWQVVPPFDR